MATSLGEMIAAPTLSLVKYETPTLVTNREAYEKGNKVCWSILIPRLEYSLGN